MTMNACDIFGKSFTSPKKVCNVCFDEKLVKHMSITFTVSYDHSADHGMDHQNKKRKKRKDHTALVPKSDTLSARSVLQTTPEELSLSVLVLENIYKMMGKDACGNQFLQLVRSYALPM